MLSAQAGCDATHTWQSLEQQATPLAQVSWGRLTAGVSGWWDGGLVGWTLVLDDDKWILLVYGRWPIS